MTNEERMEFVREQVREALVAHPHGPGIDPVDQIRTIVDRWETDCSEAFDRGVQAERDSHHYALEGFYE